MNFMNNIVVMITSFILQTVVVLAVNEDEIQELPGLYQRTPYKQYSGHLNASKGRHHFYWLFESQTNPETAPVVLWLNGGPGCSSLIGLFTENGPFKADSEGKNLTLNKNTWNSVANVIYMESPAGVGFSYVDSGVNPNNTDESTARDNYIALQSFFQKYPKLKANPFYITGESYAGVYIPMLAKLIFDDKSDINLKGVAIGNGLLDSQYLMDSQNDFAFAHGLMSTENYKNLIANCCTLKAGQPLKCDYRQNSTYMSSFTIPLTSKCLEYQREYMFPTNLYNIYDDCPPLNAYYQTITETNRKLFGERFANTLDKQLTNNDKSDSQAVNCIAENYTSYLNRAEVRKALHIPDQLKGVKWTDCGDAHYEGEGLSQKDNILQLIEKYKLQKTVVYNGDFDAQCDFIADHRFVDDLGLKVSEQLRQWKVNGGAIGGTVKRYAGGVSAVVVRGAGHMVPTDKPEAALAIIKDLIGVQQI
ncbi:unnamed protein product [Oppiella nova]|uniref:Carboxypeptidase n=1 Tax=Oppiella nova TaxID=334625 RepID=A0A7R9M4P4_9ACAR|nr:unnamed protein product [Oppiella nova]CAG2170691.1 unnamed protein product [Oppiella nova]